MYLINRFVTAKHLNVEDCRQGVCIEVQPDHIKVEGITGQVYKCERDATIVPLKNLWGESKDFAVSKGVTE